MGKSQNASAAVCRGSALGKTVFKHEYNLSGVGVQKGSTDIFGVVCGSMPVSDHMSRRR